MRLMTLEGLGRNTAMAVLLAVMILLPAVAGAESHEMGGAEAEIKALIKDANDYARTQLKDREGGVAKDGSLQFWSSGGLMQWVGADAPASEYESSSLTAKHIKVMELPGGESAVAMYYVEGSFQVKGSAAVDHYMTRALEVYVKEDGKWVVRASHWSPILGGAGTSQTSVD